jgi:hypothetical protein
VIGPRSPSRHGSSSSSSSSSSIDRLQQQQRRQPPPPTDPFPCVAGCSCCLHGCHCRRRPRPRSLHAAAAAAAGVVGLGLVDRAIRVPGWLSVSLSLSLPVACWGLEDGRRIREWSEERVIRLIDCLQSQPHAQTHAEAHTHTKQPKRNGWKPSSRQQQQQQGGVRACRFGEIGESSNQTDHPNL